MRALLDVNVLIALLDADHSLHPSASEWFASRARAGWASCPITQNGCVRIMSHPGYPNALSVRAVTERLREACASVAEAMEIAVTLELGPRYLHSTGQYHKGGPPNGVFVQLLAGEQDDEEIPGRAFGFRTLRDAQALGDAGALRGRGLPLARISLAACEAAIERALEHITTTRTST